MKIQNAHAQALAPKNLRSQNALLKNPRSLVKMFVIHAMDAVIHILQNIETNTPDTTSTDLAKILALKNLRSQNALALKNPRSQNANLKNLPVIHANVKTQPTTLHTTDMPRKDPSRDPPKRNQRRIAVAAASAKTAANM